MIENKPQLVELLKEILCEKFPKKNKIQKNKITKNKVTKNKTRKPKKLKENESHLIFIGDCKNESLVDDIFGSVSEFARQVEESGDNFEYGNIIVKYDMKKDIHSFWKKSNS